MTPKMDAEERRTLMLVLLNEPGGIEKIGFSESDIALVDAVSAAFSMYRYKSKRYGDNWWSDEFAKVAAAFGIRKFAGRLWKLFGGEGERATTDDKVESDATDLVVYGLFLLAHLQKERSEREAKATS